MNALTCPKCQAEMRTYERNGIHVDQCSGCRGIFLDRGELERLIDAEGAHYSDAPVPAAPVPAPVPAPAASYPTQPQVVTQHHHYKHKKRKSFLKEILDFD